MAVELFAFQLILCGLIIDNRQQLKWREGRERSFIGASSKKEKAIMPGSGEIISVFHLKKCMEKNFCEFLVNLRIKVY